MERVLFSPSLCISVRKGRVPVIRCLRQCLYKINSSPPLHPFLVSFSCISSQFLHLSFMLREDVLVMWKYHCILTCWNEKLWVQLLKFDVYIGSNVEIQWLVFVKDTNVFTTCKLSICWILQWLKSLQKQAWLDIFLAEFLAQIKEGKTVEEILSFW